MHSQEYVDYFSHSLVRKAEQLRRNYNLVKNFCEKNKMNELFLSHVFDESKIDLIESKIIDHEDSIDSYNDLVYEINDLIGSFSFAVIVHDLYSRALVNLGELEGLEEYDDYAEINEKPVLIMKFIQ